MNDTNFALYYPHMEFSDVNWLKSMVLFWDGIRRIVPISYKPYDDYDVTSFIDAGIISSIDPKDDASRIADDFRRKLNTEYRGADALYSLTRNRPQETVEKQYLLHPDKIDARLRDILSSKNITRATRDWLQVSDDFGRYYMLYLANAVAEQRGLAKITDNDESWTVTNYFSYDGTMDGLIHEQSKTKVINLMLENFIPENISDISATSIITFRDKYRDERKRFIESIKSMANKISKIDDTQAIKDIINEGKLDIEKSVKDLRGSLKSLKFTSLTGIKTISIPVVCDIPAVLGQSFGQWNNETVIISSAIGLSLGLLTSYSEYRGKRKELIKECDYSYLYFLQNDFMNINHHLFRNLHQFICD